MAVRCVNLDWLEVHALEPITQPHDAEYFRTMGFHVIERDYGTRIYHEMFTLTDYHDEPFIEIRRNPKSAGVVGIHSPNECHIRLHNRTCYFDNAAGVLDEFLSRYGYEFKRISRVDVCLDFERFDKGDDPQRFLVRYLKHRYAKINQGRISMHGVDEWHGQSWNSVSWGSVHSMVKTRFYNKSLQLREVKDKPYIRWSWFQAGLVDDPIACTKTKADGTKYEPTIWRVEFAIMSPRKRWFEIEVNGNRKSRQSIKNTLDMWAGRDHLWQMFASLARHYFRFVIYEKDKRKDRCQEKTLFDFTGLPSFFKMGCVPTSVPQSTELQRLLRKLLAYRQQHYSEKLWQAIDVIVNAISEDRLDHDTFGIFSAAELTALRQAIAMRSRGSSLDPAHIIEVIRESIAPSHDLFDEQ